MLVRILRVDTDPGRIDAIIDRYRETVRPIHERAAGLRRHYVLVDRDAGRITFMGMWQSRESLEDVAPMLEPARARLWSEFPEAQTMEAYELADELEHAPPS